MLDGLEDVRLRTGNSSHVWWQGCSVRTVDPPRADSTLPVLILPTIYRFLK
jgi:hypothetical protein